MTTKRCQLNVPALPRPHTPAESDNRPQTRHQHLHRVLENERLIKIKHRTSTNNGSHVNKLYFALDSALTSRANPTMPTTRPWEPTTCVSLQRVNWTAFCQRRDSLVVELQCSDTIPSNLRSEAQSLLPVFVAVCLVDVLHRNRSRHACRHGPSGSPTHVFW